MKRRIIGLFLVVVMLTLTLAGCGYSFAKDKMENYASFDKAAFEAAIQALSIEDGSFTTDDSIRAIKVLDDIYATLAKAVDKEDKKTEGTPGAYDVLYYVYYATGVKGDNTYTFFASSMKESSAKSLQLGLTSHEGVAAKIAETMKNLGDIDSYVYSTKTNGNAEAGDKVYISYTRKWTKDGSTTEEKYKYVTLELGASGVTDPAFKDALVGRPIGQEFQIDNTTFTEQINGEDVSVTYDGITIHWAVESGANIPTFTYTPYTTSSEESKISPAEPYTESSGKIDLKDIELTYYVFPVYYNEVAEISAESILRDIFGKNLSESSLPMFSEDAYKTLIGELAELYDEREGYQKDYDDAKEDSEDKTTAKDNLDATDGKIQTKLEAIFAVDTDTEGENNPNTEERIVNEYKEQIYDYLENNYISEIVYSLATEIYKLIEEITVSSYPKEAVDDAYDALIDSYKETFYTGRDSTQNKSYYDINDGSFKKFLIKETGASDYAGAKAAVRKEAEEAIKPIVQIYTVAQAFDKVFTDKEYNDTIKNTNLGTYESFYGEVNIKAAEQIDKLLDYFLEMDDEYYEEDENGGIGEIEYVDEKIVFKNVGYSLKDDSTDSE